MFKLLTPLSKITYINPRFLKSLDHLGLKTVGDLIRHFPSRYEDFSQVYRIADLEPGQQATIQGIVKKVSLRRSFRRRMTIVEALIGDDTGEIRAVWFNQPYLKNIIQVGRRMNFSGKVSSSENDIYLSHPDYERIYQNGYARKSSSVNYEENNAVINENWDGKHTGRLVPVYPETKGLTSRAFRFIIQPILRDLDQVEEFLPESVRRGENLLEINKAILKIHFPDTIEEVNEIKRRFSFQDLFLLQLYNLDQKAKLAHEKAPTIKAELNYVSELISALPFELTAAQKESLSEIIKDLELTKPMNRLLQGDVGSGKTVVAAIATLLAAKNNFQAVFMAPTEVLANQHFETMKKLFAGIEEKSRIDNLPTIGLMTATSLRVFFSSPGSELELKKAELSKKIQTGEVKIIIGTHALIQKGVGFDNLGLVVIDEQHRFGVRQRAALLGKKEEGHFIPHFLSMSATPIPRTLMLTVFGDLDISVINELPVGRKNIITKVVAPENRLKAYGFIREQIRKGRQVFVICPRIEKSDLNQESNSGSVWKAKMLADTKSVKEEYEKLAKKIFPDLRVGMLHGQMKIKEKESVMNDFRDGKIQILVSTSVIEVGVDVPNATIMMIEGADRFGLAQLYQFRGRVGRGKHQSFCLLFSDSESKAVEERLMAIVNAKSGFELAEIDLKLRGPGEFLGTSQAGLPDLAMQALQNIDLVKSSRESAVLIMKSDPTLKKHTALRERLTEFQKQIHQA